MDGAHNEDGIEALLSTVEKDSCEGKRLLMFGVMQDKRYDAMIRRIAQSGLFDAVAMTAVAGGRGLPAETLRAVWERYGQAPCSFYEDAGEAYRDLLAMQRKEDLIYIAGSLYLVGQMKSLIRRIENDRL